MPRKIRRSPGKRRRQISLLLITLAIVALVSLASLWYYYHIETSKAKSRSLNENGNEFNAQIQSSKYITEFDINPNAEPNAITADSAGNIWFTLGFEDSIAVLNPSNATVHRYKLPEPQNSTLLSWGISVENARGLVWFTDEVSNSVWSFDISSGSFTRYALPHPDSGPFQIAVDSSGNVWFTEMDGGRLGEINNQGILNEYRVPLTSTYNLYTNSSGPAGITIAKDGTIWFAEAYGNAIGSFSHGAFQNYPIQSLQSPTGIAMDSLGNLWITQHGSSDITEFNPTTKNVRTISTSVIGTTTSLPYFVYVDSLNNVWFNEHYGNAIAKYTPSNGTLIEYEVPTKIASIGNISGVVTMTLAPDGHPWFTELYSGKVGTVNPSITPYIQLNSNLSASNTLQVSKGTNSSVRLSIQSEINDPIVLKTYVADSTAGLSFGFSPSSGNGNFSSTVSVKYDPAQVEQGIYYVTISAETQQLIVSQIVQVYY
jgi:virginiamycin B lyase